MTTPRDAARIFDALDGQYPGADTELYYSNAYELLTATILSAQSTDQRVNLVTPALFSRYPAPAQLAAADTSELEALIHSTGFFRAKAKALVGMARALVAGHGGEVPADMDALTALPGVGRKTANVVLGHALGVPGLPVDRHVLRVANRIGLAEGDDPERVEAQLCALLPPARWTRASDVLILHGRRVCRPAPLCGDCSVQAHCRYFQSGAATDERDAGTGAPRRATARGATRAKGSSTRTQGRSATPPKVARGPAASVPTRRKTAAAAALRRKK